MRHGTKEKCDTCLHKIMDKILRSLPPTHFSFIKFGRRTTVDIESIPNKTIFTTALSTFKVLIKEKLDLEYNFMWNTSFSEDWSNFICDSDDQERLYDRYCSLFAGLGSDLAKRLGLIPSEYRNMLLEVASNNPSAIVELNSDT